MAGLGSPWPQPLHRAFRSLWRELIDFAALAFVVQLSKQLVLPLLRRRLCRWPLRRVVLVAEPLPLNKCIQFESVHFRFGPGQPEALRGLDLEIQRGERIGLIGSTGSSKGAK